MKIVIEGVLSQNLPWVLVLIGVGLGLVGFALRMPVLAFAVGIYLPLATMTPLFVGGLIRWIVEKKSTKANQEKRKEKGILFGSGLVGGEGLVGVGIAMTALVLGRRPEGIGSAWAGSMEVWIPLLMFTILGYLMFKTTKVKS